MIHYYLAQQQASPGQFFGLAVFCLFFGAVAVLGGRASARMRAKDGASPTVVAGVGRIGGGILRWCGYLMGAMTVLFLVAGVVMAATT
jgi:hypothetical protein